VKNLFVVNNFYDLTDYIQKFPNFNFNINNVPGSLIYNPITGVELRYDSNLSPENPHSVFYPITQGKTVKCKLSYKGFSQNGIITNYEINNNSINIKIESNITKILNNKMQLFSLLQKTPIETIQYLCELYEIDYYNSSIGVIRQQQMQSGLIYDFQILVDDDISLMDFMNSICEAGFMRTCIYADKMYFISNIWQSPHITLESFEVRNKPTISEIITENSNGGEVETPFGKVEMEERSGEPSNKISLNYESGNIIMYNLSGAYEIMRLYNDGYDYRTYKFVLPSYVVEQLLPGFCINIRKGIIGNINRLARLVSTEKNNNYYNCNLEVQNV
jgi:hypothetical protein